MKLRFRSLCLLIMAPFSVFAAEPAQETIDCSNLETFLTEQGVAKETIDKLMDEFCVERVRVESGEGAVCHT